MADYAGTQHENKNRPCMHNGRENVTDASIVQMGPQKVHFEGNVGHFCNFAVKALDAPLCSIPDFQSYLHGPARHDDKRLPNSCSFRDRRLEYKRCEWRAKWEEERMLSFPGEG